MRSDPSGGHNLLAHSPWGRTLAIKDILFQPDHIDAMHAAFVTACARLRLRVGSKSAVWPHLYVTNPMADVPAFRSFGGSTGDNDADEGPARALYACVR
jgi:hypothetical protein